VLVQKQEFVEKVKIIVVRISAKKYSKNEKFYNGIL